MQRSRRITVSCRQPLRKAGNSIRPPEEVVEVRRKAGRLRRVTTSSGRSYLVLDEPSNSRFLEEGTVLGEADLEQLEGGVALAAGVDFSCRMLARRERSEHQVREALEAEGLEDPGTVDCIVDTLKSKGYLDDSRFAAEYAGYLVGSRSAGPGMVRMRLRQAGVPPDVLEAEIGRIFSGEVERDSALRIARSRISSMKSAGREKAAGRIRGYLARRGYDPGIVSEITYRILSGKMTGDDDER